MVHLPHEVLLLIVNEYGVLEREDVLSLAQSCKSLHGVLIPTVLALFNLGDPLSMQSICLEITRCPALPKPDALCALETLLNLDSISKLSCDVKAWDIETVIVQLGRLKHFVARLPSVQEFSIQFDPGCDMGKFLYDRRTWINTFNGLFNLILEKQCEKLVVVRGPCRLDGGVEYQLPIRTGVHALNGYLNWAYGTVTDRYQPPTDTIRWCFWVLCRDIGAQSVFTEMSPSLGESHLTTLKISSMMMLKRSLFTLDLFGDEMFI